MRLNKIDLAIIEELQKNCRQSINVISEKLGISRWTISTRMKVFEDKKIIQSYTCLVDYAKLGFDYWVTFWIKVAPKHLKVVFDRLNKFEEIHWVSYILGDFDVHLIALFKNREELSDFLQNHLSKVEGILSIQSDIVLSHYYLKKEIETHQSAETIKITDLDIRIITYLRDNARSTFDEIANHVNSKAQTVRYHINRLVEKGIIKGFVANVDTWKLGYKVMAYICLQIDPPQFKTALKKVLSYPEVLWVNEASIITNLRITGIFHDRQVFRKFLREKIDCLPGIQNVKIYHVLKVLAKHFI